MTFLSPPDPPYAFDFNVFFHNGPLGGSAHRRGRRPKGAASIVENCVAIDCVCGGGGALSARSDTPNKRNTFLSGHTLDHAFLDN